MNLTTKINLLTQKIINHTSDEVKKLKSEIFGVLTDYNHFCVDLQNKIDLSPKIMSIAILQHKHGSDQIILYFDFCSGMFDYTEKATAIMHCAKGKSEDYCKKNFQNIPIKKIELE